MSINEIGSSGQILDQYRTSEQNQAKDNELGRTAFLELMVAQLTNQNPLEPTDNQAFVAQLAQFSTVEGIDNLNKTSEQLMSQFSSASALQASSLVGQSVIVEGNSNGILMNGGVVSGYTEVPASVSGLKLSITDENGRLLEQIPVGTHEAGPMSVRWDGLNLMVDGDIFELDPATLNRQEFYTDENGEQVLDEQGQPMRIPYPPGEYNFQLTGEIAGDSQQLDMQMSARVDSVTMSAGGSVTLNLTGGQRATLDQIKQILDV